MLEYLPIAVLFIVAAALAGVVVILGHIFGPKRYIETKMMPYESGMNPYGPGTRRMTVRYYLVAVLFILFDIEVIFFLPWAVVLRDFIDNSLGLFALFEMFVFILILLVGYAYAWREGALEWD
jgi:NADH-quinone oxidoreductase subunit A